MGRIFTVQKTVKLIGGGERSDEDLLVGGGVAVVSTLGLISLLLFFKYVNI